MEVPRPQNIVELSFDASVSIIPPTITTLTVIIQHSKYLIWVEMQISTRLRNTTSSRLILVTKMVPQCASIVPKLAPIIPIE
jgi:hypothetical protein